jgi:hypothetical protein
LSWVVFPSSGASLEVLGSVLDMFDAVIAGDVLLWGCCWREGRDAMEGTVCRRWSSVVFFGTVKAGQICSLSDDSVACIGTIRSGAKVRNSCILTGTVAIMVLSMWPLMQDEPRAKRQDSRFCGMCTCRWIVRRQDNEFRALSHNNPTLNNQYHRTIMQHAFFIAWFCL